MHEGSGCPIWVVDDFDNFSTVQHTHAGGREIHLLPDIYTPPPYLPFREDPLAQLIDCRRLLSNKYLRIIRDYFPGSSGVWILICGFAYILFPNELNLKICLAKGIVPPLLGSEPDTWFHNIDQRRLQFNRGMLYPISLMISAPMDALGLDCVCKVDKNSLLPRHMPLFGFAST